MTTPGQRRTPAPPRQPVVAWWVLPVTLIAVVAFATVPLGLAISGVLTGHGFAWPAGPFGLGAFRAVFTAPADPGSAWRSQPRPGGPVAAWVSMVVCFIASGALAGVAEHVAALQRVGNRLRLDRCRLRVAGGFNGAGQSLGETEGSKGHESSCQKWGEGPMGKLPGLNRSR